MFLFLSMLAWAGSSSVNKSDAALKRINACLAGHEVSGRECKHLNADVQTLIGAYKEGDASLLPILFRFTDLTHFYGDALLADRARFLGELNHLPETNQKAVAIGLAGGQFGLNRERFQTIRTALTSIPDSEPIRAPAQACLRILERINASFVVSYFPGQTFTTRAADFEVHSLSTEMYSLGEKPLWPPSRQSETVYRLTQTHAFAGPSVFTLTVSPDGDGRIVMKTVDRDRETLIVDKTLPLDQGRITEFLSLLDNAQFWNAPAESRRTCEDGGAWVMEGLQNGNYRVVVRWCAGIKPQTPADGSLTEAGELLLKLAGI